MRLICPVCGAKMVEGKICRYCGTTQNQVLTSSNKKAKTELKLKHKNEVCYSTYIPSDVSKKKLILLTIFTGLLGIHSLYVGRMFKGLYSLISFSLAFVSQLFVVIAENNSWSALQVLNNINSIFAFFAMFALIFWFVDIIAVLTGKFKVPVVLGEDKYKNNKKEI